VYRSLRDLTSSHDRLNLSEAGNLWFEVVMGEVVLLGPIALRRR
jgi:hypothetical protein